MLGHIHGHRAGGALIDYIITPLRESDSSHLDKFIMFYFFVWHDEESDLPPYTFIVLYQVLL